MKIHRAIAAGKLPSAVVQEWTSKPKNVLATYVNCGGNLASMSLTIAKERIRQLELSDEYQYMTKADMMSNLHMTAPEADTVMAECKRRGGKWIRPHPMAPTLESLTQGWVLRCSSGLSKELMSEHMRFFGDGIEVNQDVSASLLGVLGQCGAFL
jgi:hypothetical protein